jgi:hypothetical protein
MSAFCCSRANTECVQILPLPFRFPHSDLHLYSHVSKRPRIDNISLVIRSIPLEYSFLDHWYPVDRKVKKSGQIGLEIGSRDIVRIQPTYPYHWEDLLERLKGRAQRIGDQPTVTMKFLTLRPLRTFNTLKNIFLPWRISVAVAALLSLSGITLQQQSDEKWLIVPGERVGKITRHTSEEDIARVYGAQNVRRASIYVGEGESVPGTILYPADSTKRLEILWSDDSARTTPSAVMLTGDSSQWKTREGISLGTTLMQIEKINRRPFLLAGFEWDYGGTVVGWNHGRLEEMDGMLLRLYPDRTMFASPEYQMVVGDRDFSSGHPAMQKLNPRVYQMIISFRQRER